MNKKTITLVVIIAVVILLGAMISIYFGFLRKPSLHADIEKINISEIKTSFESGVSDLKLNTFDIGASLPSNLFSAISVETNFGGIGGVKEINTPFISVGTPTFQQPTNGTPPNNWQVDQATCSQFKAAPSCSFVPEQYRDICTKCKTAGF